jgi:TonB family protein
MKKITSTIIAASVLTLSFPSFAEQDFSSIYAEYKAALASEDNQKTMLLAEQALEAGKSKFGEGSLNTANLKYSLALAYKSGQQPKQAMELMDEVIEDYKNHYGEYSFEHANAVLEKLAVVHVYDFTESERKKLLTKRLINDAEETIEATIERSKEKNLNTALPLYYQFATIMNDNSIYSIHYKKAYAVNKKAEQVLLDTVGEKDQRTLRIRFMLGKYAQGKRQHNQAIDYFEKVVETVNQVLDTSHPYELASHASLVELYQLEKEPEKATQHCIAIGKLKPWQEDIEPIPLYRVDPKYPMDLARRGMEGYATLEFNITDDGFVQDIKTLNYTHKRFAKASEKALEQWRYAPKIVDGKPVVSERVKVQMDFKLG